MNYEEVVEYVFNIPRFNERGKTGNENLLRIMDGLGRPHDTHKTIHIAGTNGKGSTARFISSILCAAGKNVGVFTSPHLIRVNERISVSINGDNRDITDDEFVETFYRVKIEVDKAVLQGFAHISFFEYMFAMAAVYFADKELDYVIYETGLGGRLDATNIITPKVSVITSIGLDHMMYLGDTITKIAGEKAGIIKKGIPVVYNTGEPDADSVIEMTARNMGSPAINVAKTDYIINEFTDKTIDFSFGNRYYSYDNLKLYDCNALYQVENAMTAISACRVLKESLSDENIRKGLKSFKWPGRMERINSHLIVDGAHNIDAIRSFAKTVNTFYEGKGISLLFAAGSDKDYEAMIEYICRNISLKRVYVTMLEGSRGISATHFLDIFKRYTACDIYAEDVLEKAFKDAYSSALSDDDILFCVGSLYLVGDVKRLCMEERYD